MMFTPPTDALELPLARTTIDRDYSRRSEPNLISQLLKNDATRVLVLSGERVLLKSRAHQVQPEIEFLAPSAIQDAQVYVYLGVTTEVDSDLPARTPVVLAVIEDSAAEALESEHNSWQLLRVTGAGLTDRDAGLFTQALALANWHRTHGYCPRCGAATVIEEAGWVRRCQADDAQVFPRTDPAVIVAITDSQERLLLGSQGAWEQNRWSILAGFVEPGESLNAAIKREMFEEAGIEVENFTFVGSQAWPFPNSLMLGFFATAHHDGFKADGIEIEKLRWFTRQEIKQQAAELLLPNRVSIARAMIELWLGESIVSATELK